MDPNLYKDLHKLFRRPSTTVAYPPTNVFRTFYYKTHLIPRVHASWFDSFTSHDSVVESSRPLVYESFPGETGWDRLKAMYSKDEFGTWSVELETVSNAMWIAAVAGAVIGGFTGAVEGKDKYIKSNQGTAFTQEMEARRGMHDAMNLQMSKSCLKLAWRLGIFTGMFFLTAQSISTYRNKSSVWEYGIGGMTAGGLYRWNMGIKAMVAGGTVGGVFGLVAGGISVGVMWLTGTSYEEIRYWRGQSMAKKQSEVHRKYVEKRLDKLDEDTLMHDLDLEESLAQEGKSGDKEKLIENKDTQRANT